MTEQPDNAPDPDCAPAAQEDDETLVSDSEVGGSTDTPATLPPSIYKFAEGIALGLKQVDAATWAGVSPRTASRRAKDPRVQAQVSALRAENFARLSGRLSAAQDAAFDVVTELMHSAEHDSTRLRAACCVLSRGQDAHYVAVLETRLAALEARIDAEKAWIEEDHQ